MKRSTSSMNDEVYERRNTQHKRRIVEDDEDLQQSSSTSITQNEPDLSSIFYDPVHPIKCFFPANKKIKLTPLHIMKLLIFKYGNYNCSVLKDIIIKLVKVATKVYIIAAIKSMANASEKYIDFYELEGGSSQQFYIWPTKLGVIKYAPYYAQYSVLNQETPNALVTPKSCIWQRPSRVPLRCAQVLYNHTLKLNFNENIYDEVNEKHAIETPAETPQLIPNCNRVITDNLPDSHMNHRALIDFITARDSQPNYAVPLPQCITTQSMYDLGESQPLSHNDIPMVKKLRTIKTDMEPLNLSTSAEVYVVK